MTLVLTLSLLVIVTLTLSLEQIQASAASGTIYFVSQNESEVEEFASPAALNSVDAEAVGYMYIQEVTATSNWNTVRNAAAAGNLQALIIHYSLKNRVDWREASEWVREGVVVAGIGIPGDELADLLGVPHLFIQEDSELGFDYHIYVMNLSGEPEDISKLKEVGFPDEPVSGVKRPLSVSESSSRGFLNSPDDVVRLLGSIDATIFSATELHQEVNSDN